MSSISVILLTNGRTDGRKDGQTEGQTNDRDFNTSLAEVINVWWVLNCLSFDFQKGPFFESPEAIVLKFVSKALVLVNLKIRTGI